MILFEENRAGLKKPFQQEKEISTPCLIIIFVVLCSPSFVDDVEAHSNDAGRRRMENIQYDKN